MKVVNGKYNTRQTHAYLSGRWSCAGCAETLVYSEVELGQSWLATTCCWFYWQQKRKASCRQYRVNILYQTLFTCFFPGQSACNVAFCGHLLSTAMEISVVKLLLFVHEVVGLDFGSDVWFTIAFFFSVISGDQCLSYGVPIPSDAYDREHVALLRKMSTNGKTQSAMKLML